MSRRWVVAPMMLAGMLSLAAAMWAGLVRLGWSLPVPVERWPAVHGALMVSAFLGTLVSLERAVGLGRRWAYLAPGFTALGALSLIAGRSGALGPLSVLLGSVALAVVFAAVVRLQPALFTAIMMAGTASWVAGNALWVARWPFYAIVPWWIGFLTLTIVGERVELSRVLAPPKSASVLLALAIGVLSAGMILSAVHLAAGERLFGVGLLATALWLFRFDVAGRTVRQQGQTRYTAVCLLTGHAWLAVSGVLFLLYGGSMGGPYYDAALHAVFVGFVFAMIFAHALIIFPGLLQVRLRYGPAFYVPLVLLHFSLAMRVLGDLFLAIGVRQWGGMLNVASIVLFLGFVARSGISGRAMHPSRGGASGKEMGSSSSVGGLSARCRL